MHKPTVHVLDEDTSIAQLLGRVLDRSSIDVAAFRSEHEFLADFSPSPPGCLLLELHSGGRCTIDLYEQLRGEGHDLPVIFLAADADARTAVRAMKAGAFDFLFKPPDMRQLEQRVLAALECHASQFRRLAEAQAVQRRLSCLTRKELDVLGLVQQGLPNKAIAARLRITPRAVEMRRSNVMKKLGASSLAQLLQMVLRAEALPGLPARPGAHEPT